MYIIAPTLITWLLYTNAYVHRYIGYDDNLYVSVTLNLVWIDLLYFPLFVGYGVVYYKQLLRTFVAKDYETLASDYDDSKKIFIIIGAISVFSISLNSFVLGQAYVATLSNPVYLFVTNVTTYVFIGAGLRILAQVAKNESRF
jgi:hypothetical protein